LFNIFAVAISIFKISWIKYPDSSFHDLIKYNTQYCLSATIFLVLKITVLLINKLFYPPFYFIHKITSSNSIAKPVLIRKEAEFISI